MTASDAKLNAQCFGALQIISQDEDMMRKAVRALQRIAEKMKPKEDPTLLSREEFFVRVDKAHEEFERGEGVEFDSKEAMRAYLTNV